MHEPPNIPVCRSEFLQDFAAHLHRQLPLPNGWRSLHADVDVCEDEGRPLERLSVWITTYYFTEVRLNLWEDKVIWVSVALLPAERDNFEIGFYPDFALLGFERLVEVIIETVSVSTRLCYDETPEPLLRQIWNFNGEVEIEGVL